METKNYLERMQELNAIATNLFMGPNRPQYRLAIILTIDYAGAYGLSLPGNLNIINNEYFEITGDPDNEGYFAQITSLPFKDQVNLKHQIANIITHNLSYLNNWLNSNPDDWDYFEYIPSLIDQMLQLINLGFKTLDTFKTEYNHIYEKLQTQINKYNEMGSENGINHINLNTFTLTEGYMIHMHL